MAKKPQVTCWQCKKVFKGETACVSHAKAKKHQWTPPSAPLPITSPSGSTSTNTPVTLNPQAVIGSAPSTFVTSNIIYCPVCSQLFGTWDALTIHYSVFHTALYLTRATLHPCSVCQEFVPDKDQHYLESPRHPKCTACHDGFETAEALQRHLAERDTCDICNAHLLFSVTMQEHYNMSSMHPTCNVCWTSFRGPVEFQSHRIGCAPITMPEPTVDMHSLPNCIYETETPGRVATVIGSDSEVDDQPEIEADGTFWEATATRPPVSTDAEGDQESEYVLPHRAQNSRLEALSTPSVNAVDLEPSAKDSSWDNPSQASLSVLDGSSADSEGEAPTSPAHTEVGQGSFDGAESAIGELSTNRDADRAGVSWHCRSCLRDPCRDPVTTLCGHVFCKGCIVLVLATHMACPVCEKAFFIKLDVGRG